MMRPSAGQLGAEWEVWSSAPIFQPGEVHLWRAVLGTVRDEDASLLSADERERAERLRNTEGSRRFVARRAFLRRVLSLYIGVTPQSLVFTYGDVGKPALDLPGCRLQFNQSDSEDWCVVAVTLDDAIGVDIEVVRPRLGMDVVAGEVFTGNERAELAAATEESRLLAFLTGWTRKEALVKALGNGLAVSLKSIEVSLSREARTGLVRLGERPIADWSLLSFNLTQGVLGAVAVKHPQATLRLLQLA